MHQVEQRDQVRGPGQPLRRNCSSACRSFIASLGIASRIYRDQREEVQPRSATRARTAPRLSYGSDGPSYDLRVTAGGHSGTSTASSASACPAKQAKLTQIIEQKEFYKVDRTVRMVSRESKGFETTYNLTEPRNHSYIVGGTVVANCSEYVHLDNSSCNLASINLLKFLRQDDTFDTKRFTRMGELIITAMDISITFADFPTQKIAETTRAYRQLGIGYANLGALLMAQATPTTRRAGGRSRQRSPR